MNRSCYTIFSVFGVFNKTISKSCMNHKFFTVERGNVAIKEWKL